MDMRKLLAAGLVAGALAVSAARAQAPAAPRTFPEKVWNAPKDGLSWDKLKGKVVLIDFWNFK